MPQPIRRIAGAPHAVFVDPHIAVGHRDGVDVRIEEFFVPGHRIRDAVDVVPAAGIKAAEVFPQRGTHFHQLVASLDLLDEYINLDSAVGKSEVLFECRKDIVPERGLFGGLDLRKV